MELEQDQADETEAASGDTPEVSAEPVEDAATASETASRPDREERDASREVEARYWREEAERNRRELEVLRSAQRPDPRDEQARLEAMDPEQRITYLFEKRETESRNQVAMIEQRTTAQIDQLKFDAEMDKTAASLGWSSAQKAKYASEVEAQYTNYARQNMTIPRAALLRYRLGDELMTQGVKAVKSAASTGKANVSRQAAKMTPASSNVTGKSSGMTKAEESMKRMLEAGVLEM